MVYSFCLEQCERERESRITSIVEGKKKKEKNRQRTKMRERVRKIDIYIYISRERARKIDIQLYRDRDINEVEIISWRFEAATPAQL